MNHGLGISPLPRLGVLSIFQLRTVYCNLTFGLYILRRLGNIGHLYVCFASSHCHELNLDVNSRVQPRWSYIRTRWGTDLREVYSRHDVPYGMQSV
jgi:hypothetical protein